MKSKLRFVFIILIVSLVVQSLKSQTIKSADYNSWSAGLHFGVLKFYGDIRQIKYSPEDKFRKTNTGFTVEVAKSFNHIFGAKGNLTLGGLSGSNADMNKFFNCVFKEVDLMATVNLNNLISFYPRNAKVINVYAFMGGGAIFFNSQLKSIDEDSYINSWGYDSLGNKTSAKNTFTLPFGIGIKFKADEKFDIGIETQLNMANTDNLDSYVGNSLYNDRYGYSKITLTYKFGNKNEFVDWVKPNTDSLNAIYYASKNKPKDTTSQQIKANTKTNSNIKPVDTNKTTANNTVKTNNNTINTNNTIKNTVSEKNYFIISGNYKTKKLAKENIEKFKNKGFPEAMLLGQTSSGNWRVSIKSFELQEDAAMEYVAIKKSNSYAKLLLKKGENEYSDISSKAASIISKATVKDTAKTVVVNTNNQTINNTNTNNQNTTNNTIKNTADTIKKNTINNTVNTNTQNNTSNTNNTNTQNNTTNTNNQNNTTNTIEKKFFIISGSFATLTDANAGVAALKAKGYPDAEVVGKNDAGSYRVCFKAYATREEATKDLPVIKSKSNPSAWIFEKK